MNNELGEQFEEAQYQLGLAYNALEAAENILKLPAMAEILAGLHPRRVPDMMESIRDIAEGIEIDFEDHFYGEEA